EGQDGLDGRDVDDLPAASPPRPDEALAEPEYGVEVHGQHLLVEGLVDAVERTAGVDAGVVDEDPGRVDRQLVPQPVDVGLVAEVDDPGRHRAPQGLEEPRRLPEAGGVAA